MYEKKVNQRQKGWKGELIAKTLFCFIAVYSHFRKSNIKQDVDL